MAQKNLDVSTEDIHRVRNAARELYRETLVKQLEAMSEAIEALNDTWQGPNHEAFVAEYERRRQGIEEFHKVLASYFHTMGDAYVEYDKGEAAIGDIVRRGA